MENIIKRKYVSIKNEFDIIDKKQMNTECYEKIDMNNNITHFNFPIYYLFDNEIADDIGSTEKVRLYLRNNLKLDKLFELDNTKLIEISINYHSTIFYRLNENGNNYLYYSNSGLGIDKQLTDGNITSCKILVINNTIYDFFPEYLNYLINKIQYFTSGDFKIEKTGIKSKVNIFLDDIKKFKTIIFTDDELIIVIKYLINEDNIYHEEERVQTVCIILLNYFISKNNDYSKIFECSFNHILTGNDNVEYKKIINSLTENKTLEEIINNTEINYNSIIYSKILKLNDNIVIDDVRIINFKNLIDKFNNTLKIFSDDIKNSNYITVKYKFENSFKLEHNTISGIFNNKQESGSCVFYSYYNLALNMFVLYLHKKNIPLDEKVNDLLNVFLDFHYKMIYLLCISNDTEYIPTEVKKYSEKNMCNVMFIDKLINKNNLLQEICEFYKSNTLFFNTNKLLIDNTINLKLNDGHHFIVIYSKNIFINNNIKFYELCNILDTIIFKIRTENERITISVKNDISDPIDKIFDHIIKSIDDKTNGYNIINYHIKNYIDDDRDKMLLFFNTFKNIFVINLIILLEIYLDKELNKKIIYRNSDAYYSLDYCNVKNKASNNNTCDSKNNDDKCDKTIKGNFFDNVCLKEYLTNRLNLNELYNISFYLKNKSDILNSYKKKYNIHFNYCKYIFIKRDVINFKKPLYILPIPIDNKKFLDININNIFSNYLECKSIINNINVEISIKLKYKKIIKNIQKYCIKFITDFSKIISKLYDSDIIKKNYFSYTEYSKLICIITNGQYIIINNNEIFNYIMEISAIIDIKSYIYYVNDIPLEKKIEILLSIIQNIDNNEKLNIIKYYDSPINKIKWIGELDFEIEKITEESIIYKYKNNYYILLDNFKDEYNELLLLLSRFGFYLSNNSQLYLLYPTDNSRIEYNTLGYSTIINRKCFILISEYKKCIEITFQNGIIDVNNCYLFNKDNKDNKNKLLLNLTVSQCPFIYLLPRNLPYLCYEKNNNYYLEFIFSSYLFENYNGNPLDFLYNKNKNKNKNNENNENKNNENNENKNNEKFFKICDFKISPSSLFINIESFNFDDYNKIFDFYETNNFKMTDQIDDLKKIYNIKNIDNLTKLTLNVLKYYNYLDEKTNLILPDKKFINLLKNELETDKNKQDVYNSFISENRFCDSFVGDLIVIKQFIDEIKIIKENIIGLIFFNIFNNVNNKITEFILNNFDNWLLLMEVNILINTLSSIETITNCWDIQNILITLKSIIYFNNNINNNFFYKFELLFLLQNDYFYKENQMIKYKDIQYELINYKYNPMLKLHQFMMGKGKTAVFTPLLSFSVYLLCDKQPTIITTDNLVKQTKKYIIFIEYLLNLTTNILSDFDAKKRWIENTDETLKKKENKDLEDIENVKLEKKVIVNISNEMNIIDEFDSHHNYLQSMFNYVIEKENISNELFDYIFDFTDKKFNDINYKGDELIKIKEIPNIHILNKNLNKFYLQCDGMEYEKEYGFSFLIFEDEKFNIERICKPFTRRKTPVKNSNFSSLLLRLILTFRLYFEKYKYELQNFDYINICNNKSIIANFDNVDIIDKETISIFLNSCDSEILDIITNKFKEIYNKNNINNNKKILQKYLYYVNKEYISISKNQVNMSFQDIIYNNYNQWQVGYTGTASLTLNDYQSSEKNVFKTIVEDFDEKIEVCLALEGYGTTINNIKKVTKINNRDTVDKNIKIIVELLKDNPRGFVDLAGLFLNYNNKDIAEKLQNELIDKKIVYFSDDHEGIQYDENNNIKYSKENEENFYYYDQTHTVGHDLKQPRTGHVAIIIKVNTRWTDFAQAIFRFRKINRGTYLSVIIIENNLHLNIENNEDIYRLLINNEKIFNKNQKDGIKYQLFKTIIRKDSKNYIEKDLKPEYMRENKFNIEKCIDLIKNNIINSEEFINKNNNNYKLKIYKELNKLDKNKFIKLIIGSEEEIVLDLEKQKELQKEQQKEQEQIINLDLLHSNISRYYFDKALIVIQHLNCEHCDYLNYVKLFKSDEILINSKQIYISINILKIKIYDIIKYSNFESIGTEGSGRFCYIEFNNKILIEREDIALDYYLYKLPVYDYNGNLLVKYMNNLNNDPYGDILDIDNRFVSLLGLKNYINPKIIKHEKINLKNIVDDLNDYGFIILCYHIATCEFKRYNLSIELQNKINIFPISEKIYEDFTKFKNQIMYHSTITLIHNTNKKDNLIYIYYDIYKSIIKIDQNGYSNEIPLIDYKYIFYEYEYLRY